MTTESTATVFSADVLNLDAEREVARITTAIGDQVRKKLRRRGVVLGLSGGIDSSVCAALAVKALGRENVLGLFMPEADSAADTNDFGRLIAEHLGIETVMEDITPLLTAAGCYQRRDQFIRAVIPEYRPDYKSKIVLPSVLEQGQGYRAFSVVVQSPEGRQTRTRLPLEACLGIVAATNFKQRTRKMMEYYHADRCHYTVLGTPNRLEYDQGFFVKNGDGAADLKPIAHLYKTQVYQLAEYLQVPEAIRRRPPTTDTYSLEQSQDEFYFSLPYAKMDLCLWAYTHDVPEATVAPVVELTSEQVAAVYRDIAAKRRTTAYQHTPPLLVEPVLAEEPR